MSRTRQRTKTSPIFDRPRDRTSHVTTLTHDYPSGHRVALHFHDRDQLVYASRGVMTVRTGDSTWIVPPLRAVWIPSAIPHSIVMSGAVAMRTLYLKKKLARSLPRHCCVIHISPLLRELILHACGIPGLRMSVSRQRHLIHTLLDQLETVKMVPLQLPHPSDPRAVRVARTLIDDPSNRRPLAQLCRSSGASPRTIERLFQQEMGMTFGKWRQQLRLMHGLRLLADGAKVTYAALESGYATPSAFVYMFRRALGTTPSSYFRLRA